LKCKYFHKRKQMMYKLKHCFWSTHSVSFFFRTLCIDVWIYCMDFN